VAVPTRGNLRRPAPGVYNLVVAADAEAVVKARQSANSAYTAAMDNAAKELQKKLAELRSQLAARGIVMSGAMTQGSAHLYGEQTKNLLQARLDGLLDGYELYDVPLDEALVASTVSEILALKTTLLENVKRAANAVDIGPVGPEYFYPLVESECGVSAASVKAHIDQRMLMAKRKAQANLNIYHVHGHNPRWNANSTDNSINIVSVSPAQVFGDLRQTLTSGIPAGEEQQDILKSLALLEEAQDSPSFAKRYSDFISAAANHMTLLAPFIPALTEMLQKALS